MSRSLWEAIYVSAYERRMRLAESREKMESLGEIPFGPEGDARWKFIQLEQILRAMQFAIGEANAHQALSESGPRMITRMEGSQTLRIPEETCRALRERRSVTLTSSNFASERDFGEVISAHRSDPLRRVVAHCDSHGAIGCSAVARPDGRELTLHVVQAQDGVSAEVETLRAEVSRLSGELRAAVDHASSLVEQRTSLRADLERCETQRAQCSRELFELHRAIGAAPMSEVARVSAAKLARLAAAHDLVGASACASKTAAEALTVGSRVEVRFRGAIVERSDSHGLAYLVKMDDPSEDFDSQRQLWLGPGEVRELTGEELLRDAQTEARRRKP